MRTLHRLTVLVLAVGLLVADRSSAQTLGAGLRVEGKPRAAEVRKVVAASVAQLGRCWDELKKTHPTALGKVEISATYDAAGKLTDLRLAGPAAFADAPFKKCVSEVVLGWKLPAAAAGLTRVVMPVLFGVNEPAAAPELGAAKARTGDVEARTPGEESVSGEGPRTTASGVAERPRESDARGGAPAPAPAAGVGSAGAGRTGSATAGDAKHEVAVTGESIRPGRPAKTDTPAKKVKERGLADDEAPLGLAADAAVAGAGASTDAAAPEAHSPPAALRRGPRAVAAPAMKAGRHDDNKEYNRFLAFLSENQRLVTYPVDVSERLLIRVLDKDGKSLPNCKVEVKAQDGKALAASTTFADGTTQFFPADKSPPSAADYVVAASCGAATKNGQLARAGRRTTEVRFDTSREVPARVPVDVAIVLDTTGSMQSQIDRLKQTLQAIHFQLTSLPARPDIRFALVAYRDKGDEYVTKVWPFTGVVDEFQKVLDGLSADGGGDTPEDLQSALAAAMHELVWRPAALRIGFVVADAVPHTDYGQAYTYRDAMREGLARGVKWVTVGAGGLPRQGEVIFRQIAQFTMGEYVFVTEGAMGDAEGGAAEASHHVGTNYLVENLDQAIVRIVRRELSYLTDSPKEVDDTIVARGSKATPRDELLAPAVAEVLRQLADYSTMQLGPKTPLAVVPVAAGDAKYKDVAGYLTDQFALAASRAPAFKLVERDLQALAAEHKLQLSDLFDVTESVPIGKLIGAEVLVVAKLVTRGEEAELFAKLLRVETGEVLSVAKVRVTGGVI